MTTMVLVMVSVGAGGGSERASRRTGRLDDSRERERERGEWGGEGAKREDREGTKGKRVQAGLGSDRRVNA